MMMHRYDAGWPRDDSEGCIVKVPCECDDPDHDGHQSTGNCGKPEHAHQLSEYNAYPHYSTR